MIFQEPSSIACLLNNLGGTSNIDSYNYVRFYWSHRPCDSHHGCPLCPGNGWHSTHSYQSSGWVTDDIFHIFIESTGWGYSRQRWSTPIDPAYTTNHKYVVSTTERHAGVDIFDHHLDYFLFYKLNNSSS